jgi:hypothetical protein
MRLKVSWHYFELVAASFGKTVVEHQFDVVFAGSERPVAIFGLIAVQPVVLNIPTTQPMALKEIMWLFSRI